MCQGYEILDNPDRKDTNTRQMFLCDARLPAGWYRFEGEAGTRMPTECVEVNRCDTIIPGWLNGGHPTVADGKVVREVCFNTIVFGCCGKSLNIEVKNCTSYHVYKLISTPGCPLGYRGTD